MHKSRKIILATTFSLFFFFGYSQIETYDLSKFVQDNYTIRTLSITPNFFFDSDNEKINTNITAQGGGSINMRYTNFTNNANSYSSYDSNNSLSARGFRRNLNNRTITMRSMLANDYLINRYYTEEAFISLEVDNYLSLSKVNNYIAGNNSQDYLGVNTVNIAVGKGRIQNIADPLKALAILKLLKADNYLLREVTHQDIDELSNTLTRLRSLRNTSTRFTDFRLLNIAKFEQLGKALVEMGLVENDGFGMAALLYDAWRFESFFNRFTNNEFRIGIEASQSYNEQKSSNTITQLYYFNGLFVSYTINKPIDTEWFYAIESKVGYGYVYDKLVYVDEETFYSKGPRIFLNSEWVLGFQPSARVSSSLNTTLRYRRYFLNPEAAGYWTDKFLDFNISSSMNYYVSPQYRLSGNIGLRNSHFSRVDFSEIHQVELYFNLAVNYFLF